VGTEGRHASTGARHHWLRDAVKGGIVAGLVGAMELALFRVGLAAMLYWVVALVVNDRRYYPARFARGLIWSAVKLPAFVFVRGRALEPGFDGSIVALGVLSHVVMSLCWGVLFGLVAHGLSRRAILGLGVAWGVMIWWIFYFVALPLLGVKELRSPLDVTVVFVPYGVAMAVGFILWQRRAHRHPGTLAREHEGHNPEATTLRSPAPNPT
jgi:hypothetical protein